MKTCKFSKSAAMVSWSRLLAGIPLLFLSLWVVPLQAQPAVATKEYEVKAAFLFNFARFVEWPTNAFNSPQAPLVIGILGTDPFGAALNEIVRGEIVNGHPLIIQRYRNIEEVQTCHILFISSSEARRLEQIFKSLRGKNVLTVGESDGFAHSGGIIRFIADQNRIRFRVNLDAARAAELTISSKLLRAAEIVKPGQD